MELPTCPICGEPGRFLFTTPDYRLENCTACSLVYKSASTEESHEAVNGEIYTSERIYDRRQSASRLRSVARRRAKTLTSFLPDGARILEVGPGAGEFLTAVTEQGCKAEAVDLSDAFARHINEELKFPCFHGRIEDLPADQCHYQAVVAFDVFEHLTDPMGFLAEMIKRVEPGGLLYLEMPNWDSQARMMLGALWNMLNIRDHFLFTSQKTWKKLAGRLGMDVLLLDSHEAYWEAIYALLFAILNYRRIDCRRDPGSRLRTRSAEATPPAPNPRRDRLRRYCAQELPAGLARLAGPLSGPLRAWLCQQGRGTQISVLLRTRGK